MLKLLAVKTSPEEARDMASFINCMCSPGPWMTQWNVVGFNAMTLLKHGQRYLKKLDREPRPQDRRLQAVCDRIRKLSTSKS